MAGGVVPADPGQEGDRGAQVGVQNRRGCVRVGEVGVAAVEPVPAHPEQARSDRDHRQVVRSVDLAVALEARPDHRCCDEPRDPGREMDHVAAGEVEGALLGEVAAAPDQERVDRVDEARPEDHERDPGLEVDPAEHRAEHQDRRDRREDELEVSQRRLRERKLPDVPEERDRSLVQQRRAVENRPGVTDEVGEEARLRSTPKMCERRPERHLEAVSNPDEEHQGERDEGHHHRVHRPALLHHAAVEDDEAGHAHQTDERRRRHLPGVVTRTQPVHAVSSFPREGTDGPFRLTTTRAGRPRLRLPTH